MKVVRYIIFFGILSISAAYYFTPTEKINSIQPPNWADIVSAAIAFVGLVLAFTTYVNWHSGKIKEDAYNSVKRYASLLAEIEDIIMQVHFDICGITPLDLKLLPDKEAAMKVISGLGEAIGATSSTMKKLHTARSELPFWGASLKPDAEAIHTNLMRKMHDYMALHFELLGMLHAYYGDELPDGPVLAKHKDLHICANEMFLLFTERKKARIQNLFKFE
ncbi:hypothetical protein [Pseudomonas paraeruginosa]|uniref:hypothetical protein n=1 Tax=Pseudomonas aeruginosa TaxID=287 RepID=UPI0021E4EA39|nr:hypothetical protein [Pseudomonas aeruginosa]MCV2494865.1 hypothetical protein [Pseudomonas aeruginosa]